MLFLSKIILLGMFREAVVRINISRAFMFVSRYSAMCFDAHFFLVFSEDSCRTMVEYRQAVQYIRFQAISKSGLFFQWNIRGLVT